MTNGGRPRSGWSGSGSWTRSEGVGTRILSRYPDRRERARVAARYEGDCDVVARKVMRGEEKTLAEARSSWLSTWNVMRVKGKK